MHSPASASSAAYHVQLLSTVKAVTMISQIAKSCQAPRSLIDAFTSHKTDQHIRVINWANEPDEPGFQFNDEESSA